MPHTRAQGLRSELEAATAASAAAAQAAAAAETSAAAEGARHGEEAGALGAALDQARSARAGGWRALRAFHVSRSAHRGQDQRTLFPLGSRTLEDLPSLLRRAQARTAAAEAHAQRAATEAAAEEARAFTQRLQVPPALTRSQRTPRSTPSLNHSARHCLTQRCPFSCGSQPAPRLATTGSTDCSQSRSESLPGAPAREPVHARACGRARRRARGRPCRPSRRVPRRPCCGGRAIHMSHWPQSQGCCDACRGVLAPAASAG